MAKRAGAVLTLAISVVWVAAIAREFLWNARDRGGPAVQLYDGCLAVGTNPLWVWAETGKGWHVTGRAWVDVRWTPSFERLKDGRWRLMFPLWIPLAVVAAATVILCWFDGHRVFYWAALSGGAITAAVWVFSLFFGFGWRDQNTAIFLQSGAVVREADPAAFGFYTGRSEQPWHLNRLVRTPAIKWLPSHGPSARGRARVYRTVPSLIPTTTVVPIWPIPIGCFGFILVIRFRKRKPVAGECRTCGYDLTGNVSGVCPECGQAVRPVRADVKQT
jgi:hypothetical protein